MSQYCSSETVVEISAGIVVLAFSSLCLHHSFQTLMQYCVSLLVLCGIASFHCNDFFVPVGFANLLVFATLEKKGGAGVEWAQSLGMD